MSTKRIAATVLQAAGVLAVSTGVSLASFFAGVITLGLGLVAFGIALERDS